MTRNDGKGGIHLHCAAAANGVCKIMVRTLASPAWDNVPATVTSEHDEPNSLGYNWVDDYCMIENHHPGLDISLPCGTTLYAITDGIITCAGTGIGSGSDGSVCNAYNNSPGYCAHGVGQGRVQLQIDADHYLIYGHCRQALVPAGTSVTAGQAIAISGAGGVPPLGGDHLHIEYRVRDSSCVNGWRIEDPEPLLLGQIPEPEVDWEIGDVVVTNDSGVNLRDEAGTSSTVITSLPINTRAIVMNQYGLPTLLHMTGTRF